MVSCLIMRHKFVANIQCCHYLLYDKLFRVKFAAKLQFKTMFKYSKTSSGISLYLLIPEIHRLRTISLLHECAPISNVNHVNSV